MFYLKMKGDYLRYLARVQNASATSGGGGDAEAKAKEAYHQAWTVAKSLDSTHPIKLGLALNMSVFQYEIELNPHSAFTFGQQVRKLEGRMCTCTHSFHSHGI